MIDKTSTKLSGLLVRGFSFLAAGALMVAAAGCQTDKLPTHVGNYSSVYTPPNSQTNAAATDALVLHPGDSLKISFPGAPNMDAQTSIRLDGKISLPLVGEVNAAGLTPAGLEAELLTIAGPQLVVKQVSVTVLSSAFECYVAGAVLRAGKLTTDRVVTPLEAIMEAGIDYNKANLRKVQIIRKGEKGQTKNFKLDLQKTLKGETTAPFALEPYDIIYVPERFNWF